MQKKPRQGRPRVAFICDESLKNDCQDWATAEGRTLSNVIERCMLAVMESKKSGQILNTPNPGEPLPVSSSVDNSKRDLAEVKEFVKLLLGERDRNGLSFIVLGEILGMEAESLHTLYTMLLECKQKLGALNNERS